MKSPVVVIAFGSLLAVTASAFQVAPLSSFTGRGANSIHSSRQRQQQSARIQMGIVPPFLKKLGSRGAKQSQDDDVAVLERTSDDTNVATNDMKAYLETVKSVEVETTNGATTTNGAAVEVKSQDDEEEQTETQKLMQQVKDAGLAGIISYALWELGFWAISVPVCVFGYYELTGHLPDFSNAEDMQKLGAEAFAFVNFARFAVPLRIGLALSTTPWIEENIVEVYFKKHAKDETTNGETTNGSSE
jgi:hypothetical protein